MKLNEQVKRRLKKLAGLPSSKKTTGCHPASGCWNCRPGHLEFGDVCVPAPGEGTSAGNIAGTPMFNSLHECVSSGCSIGNNQADPSFP